MFRRSGSWVSDFWIDGRRFKKSWGPVSPSVAKEKEAKFKRDIRSGEFFEQEKRITFENLVEKFMEFAKANRKPSTVRRYRYSYQAVKAYIKADKLSEITAELAENYKQYRLDADAAPATVNREIDFLRCVMKKAVHWRYLARNPLQSVAHLKEAGEKMWTLSEKQEERLLEECQKSTRTEYLRDLVALALQTGMRQGEIFNLTKSNVRLKDRYVQAVGTKTGEDRNVPLNDKALEVVKRRLEVSPSEFLFCDRKGRPLRFLTTAFWNAAARAGLVIKDKEGDAERFRFHDLRHSFGSRLGMAGIDTKTIMEIMGHSTHKMAMRYQHPTPDHKLEAVKAAAGLTPNLTPGKIIKIKKKAKTRP